MTKKLSQGQIDSILASFQSIVDEGMTFADDLIKKHQPEVEEHKADHDSVGQYLHETIIKAAQDYKAYLAKQTTAYRKIVEGENAGMDEAAKNLRRDVIRETETVGEYVTYLEEDGYNDMVD
jgi:hypothetical protein